MIVKVEGIHLDSELSEHLDSLDVDGNGEFLIENKDNEVEEATNLLELFIDQGKGTFSISLDRE